MFRKLISNVTLFHFCISHKPAIPTALFILVPLTEKRKTTETVQQQIHLVILHASVTRIVTPFTFR